MRAAATWSWKSAALRLIEACAGHLCSPGEPRRGSPGSSFESIKDLADGEPVAEHADRGEVVLHRRHRSRVSPDVGGHVERRLAPPEELPDRPRVRRPRPRVGDPTTMAAPAGRLALFPGLAASARLSGGWTR